jgi:hypothetical protein
VGHLVRVEEVQIDWLNFLVGRSLEIEIEVMYLADMVDMTNALSFGYKEAGILGYDSR